MKRFLLLLLTSFFIVSSFSQSRTELGVLLGTSYYHGDINQSTIFYSPSLAYGLIVKYNLSDHLSSTLNVSYGKLKGSDSDFNQIENQLGGASFSSGIIDVNAIIEFNFLPYNSSGYIKKNKIQ